MSKGQKLFYIVFIIICTTGFVYQLQQVSQVYFRYQTTTRLELKMIELEEHATVVFCSRYIDLIDRRNYIKYGLQSSIPIELTDIVDEQAKLKIKDIFELTPSTHDTLRSCMTRSDILGIPQIHSSNECLRQINVSKVVTGEHICYSFTPKTKKMYSPGIIASSMNYMSVVYDLELNHHFSAVTAVSFIVHFASRYASHPLGSRLYAAISVNNQGIGNKRFFLSYENNKIDRLPPQYDTNCSPGHFTQKCYEDCLLKEMKSVNRVPWSAFIDEPIDSYMMTNKDLENETMINLTTNFFSYCHEKCKTKIECHTEFAKTKLFEATGTPHNLSRISCMIPAAGDVQVISIPTLTLIEYIVQVGSCLGAWFGLSVFSINPLKWRMIQKWKKKAATSNTKESQLPPLNSLELPKCTCMLCVRTFLHRYLSSLNMYQGTSHVPKPKAK